jgi:hypothetical protein
MYTFMLACYRPLAVGKHLNKGLHYYYYSYSHHLLNYNFDSFIITILSSLLKCYKLPCFVLCVCFTRAHFIIGPWSVELARKYIRIEWNDYRHHLRCIVKVKNFSKSRIFIIIIIIIIIISINRTLIIITTNIT